MRILCVYYSTGQKERGTVEEHLYSVQRYSNEECYFLNAYLGVPRWLPRVPFDLVIYHYTFLALKWIKAEFHQELERSARLRDLSGYKVAIHQDEYLHTRAVNDFLREFGIKTVVTCVRESEWELVYPRSRSGLEHYLTVEPGYVDEEALARVEALLAQAPARDIDVGYRARRPPFYQGRFGQLKADIGVRFQEAECARGLRLDISSKEEDVFKGDDWYRFLLRCRASLGTESGSSLLDETGEIKNQTDAYLAEHPGASYDEVEAACFPGVDGNLRLFALGPRHFQYAMTRTCQVLLEGEYNGVLQPGVHYIEVKRDWSNIPEAVEQIQDAALCERLAENAHRDLVRSGRFTYRAYVERLLGHVREVAGRPRAANSDTPATRHLLELLRARERHDRLLSRLESRLSRASDRAEVEVRARISSAVVALKERAKRLRSLSTNGSG